MKQSLLYRDLHAQLSATVTFLPDKPEETADSTLCALWLLALGQKLSAVRALSEPLVELDPTQQSKLREWVRRRIEGVPLSHLTERQYFMGLELLAGPQALVPRAETELLVRVAVELARSVNSQGGILNIVDACTGSGNVALAIAHNVPAARLYAADLSEDAVALARQNAQHLGMADRIELRAGDLLAPFDTPQFLGQVSVLTCNPPYISSAKLKQMPGEIAEHEPALAFDGGPFGVSILMRLLQEAPRFLKTGGWLAFEAGLGQGPALVKRLSNNPLFDTVRSHQDSNGDIRVVSARRT